MTATTATRDRFWSKVDTGDPDECWPWTGSTARGGAGQFWMDGGAVPAPRAAWELTHGPIHDRLRVIPTCDRRACCNTRHMKLGTHQDVADVRVANGRQARGERQAHAVLTDSDVETIRATYAGGCISQRLLGLEYGVTPQEISLIVRGEVWTHVGGPRTFRERQP